MLRASKAVRNESFIFYGTFTFSGMPAKSLRLSEMPLERALRNRRSYASPSGIGSHTSGALLQHGHAAINSVDGLIFPKFSFIQRTYQIYKHYKIASIHGIEVENACPEDAKPGYAIYGGRCGCFKPGLLLCVV